MYYVPDGTEVCGFYECEECGKRFRVNGSIWEYPMGAYNYEDIDVEIYDDEIEDE